MFNNGVAANRGDGRPPLTAPSQPPQMNREIVVTIQLQSPLPYFDREIGEIQLRAPVFGDWTECGDIHQTTIFDPRGMQTGSAGAVRVEVNAEAVMKWFVRLSGLPAASLAKLSMHDSRLVLREVVKLVGSLDSGN